MSEVLAQLKQKGSGELKETVLWTNPSPTANYSGGRISLSDNINNYKYLKFVWKESTSRDVYVSVIAKVDEFKTSSVATAGTATNAFSYGSIYFKQTAGTAGVRLVYYATDNSLEITTAFEINGQGLNASLNIPYQVIGLK